MTPAFFHFSIRPTRGMLGLLAGFWLCGTLHAQESPAEGPPEPAPVPDQFSPKVYPLDRYQKIRGKSPFEFELAKPKAEDAVSPFADLALAGFAGSERRLKVYLVNNKTQERITVAPDTAGAKNETGFRVISINRGATLSKTTVRLEKDGQQEDLGFDTTALYSMSGGAGGSGAPGAAVPGRPGVPGQPNNRPGIVRPAVPGQAAPQQAYQAPKAFIPGQPAVAAAAPGQPGVPVPFQPGGAVNPQQQINTLVNPGQQASPQPVIAGQAPAPVSTGGRSSNNQPRRRVVLPTPSR